MKAKAKKNKNATATNTQKTPVEHPFFLSGCRGGKGGFGAFASLIAWTGDCMGVTRYNLSA